MKFKEMQDLEIGDQILWKDGNYYNIIDIQSIHIPNQTYKIKTSNGEVICSDLHPWVLYKRGTECKMILESYSIYNLLNMNLVNFSEYNISEPNGPKFLDIEKIEDHKCMCITTDSPDNHFAILTNDLEELIYSHNCAQRLVCGRLDSVPSRMALGNQQATTINGQDKGAGMVKAQGKIENIKYYFENHSWIEQWFLDRGLNERGWEFGEDPSQNDEIEEIDLGDDGEEISIKKEETVIEFAGEKGIIDNTKNQKFDEV